MSEPVKISYGRGVGVPYADGETLECRPCGEIGLKLLAGFILEYLILNLFTRNLMGKLAFSSEYFWINSF